MMNIEPIILTLIVFTPLAGALLFNRVFVLALAAGFGAGLAL